jgi:hypothetical protein
LLELIADIAGRLFLFSTRDALDKLIRDELAIERAVNFTSSFGTVGNVLGDSPKANLGAWSDQNASDYPLKRAEVWDAEDRRALAARRTAEAKSVPVPGGGPPPHDRFDPEHTRHTHMQTVSLIREVLWNQAGWTGAAFVWEPTGHERPVLALVFTNSAVAGQIMTQLHKEVGPEDGQDALRISIIRGIDKGNLHAYRVVVGSNPMAAQPPSTNKIMYMVARVQTMTPSSSSNLDNFLACYNRFGSYYLTYAVPDPNTRGVNLYSEPLILKTHLHVRQAWQIGLNDLDCTGLCDDDDPIVPPDEPNAPVIQLLRWMHERK